MLSVMSKFPFVKEGDSREVKRLVGGWWGEDGSSKVCLFGGPCALGLFLT